MALSTRDQLTYWGIAGVALFAVLWFLGDVLLPFVLGAAIAYFLDPIADKLESLGLSRILAVLVISLAGLIFLLPASIFVPSTLPGLSLPLLLVTPMDPCRLNMLLGERACMMGSGPAPGRCSL